jgi:hypothetical protein
MQHLQRTRKAGMTDARKYDEVEVARIFEAASAPVPASLGRGLTLPELEEIGREVGIPPARISDAAAALDRQATPIARRVALGMPVGVGRTASLPRQLTDREWGVLVAELRTTFGAQGRDLSTGEMRHWANSRLHACVEPTLDGWRLRLGTEKGDAAAVNMIGAAGIIVGLSVSGSMLASGEPFISGLLLMLVMGGGALGVNAWRLPRWARTREQQMEHIIERARAIIGADD